MAPRKKGGLQIVQQEADELERKVCVSGIMSKNKKKKKTKLTSGVVLASEG